VNVVFVSGSISSPSHHIVFLLFCSHSFSCFAFLVGIVWMVSALSFL